MYDAVDECEDTRGLRRWGGGRVVIEAGERIREKHEVWWSTAIVAP